MMWATYRASCTASQSQLLSYDYGKIYNREDFTDLLEADKKCRNKGKAIDVEDLDPESCEMVEMLLQWASSRAGTPTTSWSPAAASPWAFFQNISRCRPFKTSRVAPPCCA